MFRSIVSIVGMSLLLGAACPHAAAQKDQQVRISGSVLDHQGRPVSNVQVRSLAHKDTMETTTDAKGKFEVVVPKSRIRSFSVIADDLADRLGSWRADWESPPSADAPIELVLKPCRKLPIAVTDRAGEPAADTLVGAMLNYAPLVRQKTDEKGETVLRLPADAELQSLYALKPDIGFDYRIVATARDKAHQPDWLTDSPIRFQLAESQTVELEILDTDEKPIDGMEARLWLVNKPGEPDSFNLSYLANEFVSSTDEFGIATFRGVPNWNVHPLTFWPSHDDYDDSRIRFDPAEHPDGRKKTLLTRLVSMSGRVETPDGSPAAGIKIKVNGANYGHDGFHGDVTTKEDGSFELMVSPDQLYMLAVMDKKWAAPAVDGFVVRPDSIVTDIEFKLQPSVRISGRVTVAPDTPVSKQRMSLRLNGTSLRDSGEELPNPENSRTWVQTNVFRSVQTDEDGRYEFFVGPGKYMLGGPSALEGRKFEVTSETAAELKFNFESPRPEAGPFRLTVVTGKDATPVPDAIVEGIYRAHTSGRDLRMRTDANGVASAERKLHRTVLFVQDEAKELAGIMEINEDQPEATITIGPLASASGRTVDALTGDPLPNKKVDWGRRVHIGDDDAPWQYAWGGSTVSDKNGFFRISGLVTGQLYTVNSPSGTGLTTITEIDVEPGHMDLGEVEVKPPYKPPTLEERIDRALAPTDDAMKRFEAAIAKAAELRQHVLVVFVDYGAPLTRSWFKLRLEDRHVRSSLANYQLLQVAVDAAGAVELGKHLDIELTSDDLPICRFSDASNKELTSLSVPRAAKAADDDEPKDSAESTVDRGAIMELLSRHAPEPLDAGQLLKDALAKAKKSNRRVLIQETATWCGPCHKLARFLEEHRSKWEQDYIWIKMDARWKGAEDVMNNIKEGYRGGIPWCAVLDAKGEMLANSDGPEGNIGFPNEPEGIEHFMQMLKSTKQRMTVDDLRAIRDGLEKY